MKQPKMEALNELAKVMSKLNLDKLKGYKKTSASAPEELPALPEELEEEEVPALEDESDEPKGFSQVLEAIAKKKMKKH